MYTAIALTRYGSLEIKRAYRKNMTAGIVISALIMISSITAFHLVANTKAVIASMEPVPAPDTIIIINVPIPRIYEVPKSNQVAIERPIPKSGIPTPVPDAEAPENATIPSQSELEEIINRTRLTDSIWSDDVVVSIEDTEQLIPKPGTFVRYDEPPQTIESVAPIYPEMARVAGVQGDVWIQAYIDKNGNVKAVEILKASGANAGFEESAIAAARQTTWTPAISNGQPVGVWVSYKIEFRLK